jgi:hypothetical protein
MRRLTSGESFRVAVPPAAGAAHGSVLAADKERFAAICCASAVRLTSAPTNTSADVLNRGKGQRKYRLMPLVYSTMTVDACVGLPVDGATGTMSVGGVTVTAANDSGVTLSPSPELIRKLRRSTRRY